MKLKTLLIHFFAVSSLLTVITAHAQSAAVIDSKTPPSSPAVTQTTTRQEPPKNLSVEDVQRFGNAVHVVKNFYVEPTSDRKLFEEAIRGMLAGLDPHSSYLDEEDLKDLRGTTSGQFSGLGLEITQEDGYIKVITPIDGSPAAKGGIKPGDLILLIDGVPVKGMLLRDAVKKMRGKKGTDIHLTILRKSDNKPAKVKLTRDDIHVQSVKGKLLDKDYAYIRINSFQSNTTASLLKTLKDLREQAHGKLKGLVLDLRNNPGGLLDAAVGVSDTFLDVSKLGNNKLIVYTKGRLPGSQVEIKANSEDFLEGAPIVVLINEGSASGSEIVAGALQDHKRAIIVGTNSFGKGSVQTVIPLDQTSALKLTTALYYTPLGRSIQAKGIVPDVLVKDLKVTENEKEIGNIKEADLSRHLANGNAKKEIQPEKKLAIPDLNPTQELATTDYQLSEALNILKGVVSQANKN
jgi:carboxyl-terminal processing protease